MSWLLRSHALRITLIYAAVAALWIVVSDEIAAWIFADETMRFKQAQTFKGLAFVALMSGIVYTLVLQVQRMHERNREVEAMLMVSQKLEIVGSFAATVAHDMSNVVTLLNVFTEQIKRDQEEGRPVDPDHLVSIDRAVDRAQTLTRQLSAFLRKSAEEIVQLDVGDAIQSAEPLLRQAAGKQVKFTLQLPTEPLRIEMGEGALDQALLNLVVNARHAMEPRRPRELAIVVEAVELRRHRTIFRDGLFSGSFVCIRVKDTGPGIPRSEWVKVFDPFYTTKPMGEGTGLGLASVMSTFRQHGGWVELSSKLGVGTEFKLYAPALN